MRRSVATAVLAAVLAGGPARGDSGWREVQAPHVVLRTDLGSRAAREAALTVERYRAQIIAAAWPRARLPAGDRIEMTVFSNGLDFERHFGRTIAGIFFHDVPPYAVMYGAPDTWEHRESLATTETTSILRHELVHHLAGSVYRRQPRWFAEGLAQFLETVRTGADGKSVVVGAVNLEAVRKYNAFRSIRVADALGWSGPVASGPEGKLHGLYGMSWLLVHWLFNTHAAQFDQLQILLAKGIDPEKAWQVIRPGLATPDLDEALNQYVKHGEYTEFSAPFTPPAVDTREAALSEADVHSERARVALSAARFEPDQPRHQEEARTELAKALELDPGSANALVLRIREVRPEERLPLARRLTQAHPDDVRGWVLLGGALAGDRNAAVEREAAYRKAIALRADDPTPQHDLAWMYLQQGRAADAAPLIARAVELAPYDASTLDTLAAVQARLGRCSEAAGSEARAIDALPEGISFDIRDGYEKRLAQYRTRCSSAPAAPTAP